MTGTKGEAIFIYSTALNIRRLVASMMKTLELTQLTHTINTNT